MNKETHKELTAGMVDGFGSKGISGILNAAMVFLSAVIALAGVELMTYNQPVLGAVAAIGGFIMIGVMDVRRMLLSDKDYGFFGKFCVSVYVVWFYGLTFGMLIGYVLPAGVLPW